MQTVLRRLLVPLALMAAVAFLLLSSLSRPGVSASSASLSSEADVKIQSQIIGTPDPGGACVGPPPTEIPVNTDVTVCVRRVLHNNGPASYADITMSKTAEFVPQGQPANQCTVTPSIGLHTLTNVPLSVTKTYDENFVINCSKPSSHKFRFQTDIQPGPLGTTDPNPTNNSATTDLTVGVTALADFGIISQDVLAADCNSPPPSQIPINTDVTLCVTKVLHNVGPFGPSTPNVFVRATPPPNCTVDPEVLASATPPLEVSVNHPFEELFTIRCSQPSFHTFLFENFLNPNDPHVSDPVSGNNTQASEVTVAAIAQADVKITAQTLSGPLSASPNQPFTLTLDKTLHNNGPLTPTDVTIATTVTTVSAPPDCSITPDLQNPTSHSLDLSVDTDVTEHFYVTCSDPSLHHFSIENCLSNTDPHVQDPNTANNCRTSNFTVPVTAEADVKITAQSLSGPPSAEVSQPFTLALDKTLHNNGPFGPAPVTITTTVSAPIDCTVTPDPQNPTSQSLDVSIATDISEQFSVTCSDPSFHDFTVENCVSSANPHLDDLDPTNNCLESQLTVPVEAEADVKITSQILTDPPLAGTVDEVAIDMDPVPVYNAAGLEDIAQFPNFGFCADGLDNGSDGVADADDPDCNDYENPANGSLGPRDACKSVNVGSFWTIDVTVKGVDALDRITGHQFVLNYNPAKINIIAVQDVQMMLAAAGGSGPFFPGSEATPSADGTFSVAGGDLGTAESGDGVLARITLKSVGAGLSDLTLTGVIVVDDGTPPTPIPTITAILGGQEAQDEACPGPPPVTLDISKTDSPDPVAPGADLTYTITADIQGDATDFSITDPLPSGTTFVSDECNFSPPSEPALYGSVDPGNVWSILLPGGPTTGTFICTITVEVSAGLADGTMLTNTATASAAGADPVDSQTTTTVFASPPLTFNVGETFGLKLDKVLHNNGPFGPVDVDISTTTLNVPTDCTVTPDPQNPTSQSLDVSVPADVAETFTASCDNPSLHELKFENCISPTGLHVTDTDEANNCAVSSITVIIVDQADVKITSLTLSGPPSAEAGEPFTLTLDKTLHNNGTSSPVDVSTESTVSGPPDCDITPDPFDPTSASLDASVATPLSETFTVTCAQPSDHSFSVESCIEITSLHVADSDPDNNCDTSESTLDITAQADLHIVSQEIKAPDCSSPPPSEAPLNTDVTVCLTKTVHNAGPFLLPTDAKLDIAATAPTDCTVTPIGSSKPVGGLQVSVNQSVQELFTINCSRGGFHTFQFTNTISSADPHLIDPDTVNNSLETPFTVLTIEADVKVASVTVNCPGEADVNSTFTCSVDVTLHNNGPTENVSADLTVELVPPYDCSLTSNSSQSANAVPLSLSIPKVVTLSWQVECDDPSFHEFTAIADVALDPPSGDPDPGNNSGTGQDTTAVFASTDIKAVGIGVDGPPSTTADSPFDVTVNLSVHNNGPVSPIKVEGGVGLAAPEDCSFTPGFSQLFNVNSLTSSTTVVIDKDWQITCSDPGAHQFVACGRAGPDDQHVFDDVPYNNFDNAGFVVNVDGTTPIVHTGTSCAIPGDPPEVCGDDIDNDGDTLVDEEPDTDGDGINDCDDPDDDNDQFTDAVEAFIGTDPLNSCPRGPFDNAWPVDVNNDRTVNIVDVLALKPVFGSTDGDGAYARRNDLNANTIINIVDVLALKPFFGESCPS